MSFDTKCYELAEYFLSDGAPENYKRELAQVIQDAIENELHSHEREHDDTCYGPDRDEWKHEAAEWQRLK